MTPPINIDGSKVSDVTIDGQDVEQITIDGQDVLSAIPDTLIDTFEDESNGGQYGSSQSLSDFYGGDLSAFTRQTSTALEGNKSLEGTTPGPFKIISSTSGLNRYPDQGDSWEFLVEPTASKQFSGMIWATQTADNTPSGYFLRVDARGAMQLYSLNGSSRAELTSASASWDLNATNRVEIDWSTSGDITARAYDSGNVQLGSLTYTDTTYTDGGIGWWMNENTGGTSSFFFDAAQII